MGEDALSKPAIAVRVTGLGDIARLASSMASRMVVLPVYRFRHNGRVVYALQTIYKDYYKFYGIPVIYYYATEDDGVEDEKAKYILARVDEMGEKVEVTDRVRPGWVAIPIINLASKPPFMPDDI